MPKLSFRAFAVALLLTAGACVTSGCAVAESQSSTIKSSFEFQVSSFQGPNFGCLIGKTGCWKPGLETGHWKLETVSLGGPAMSFALRTTAFANGGDIPAKYTCSGADVSPQLTWTEPPARTQSLALIVDDPDAPRGTFTHWILYNLNPQTKELPENFPKAGPAPRGAARGRNGFGATGYRGPCPPPGKPHRYFFKLYALDTKLNLKPDATQDELESAMKGHVLAQAEWMGKFKR